MTMPERTRDQRMQALGRANGVRTARAKLKNDVRHGQSVVEVIRHPPCYAVKMKVFELLLAVPSMGTVKVTKVLGECQVATTKTLGGLTDRQRFELVRCVQRARVGTNHVNSPTRMA